MVDISGKLPAAVFSFLLASMLVAPKIVSNICCCIHEGTVLNESIVNAIIAYGTIFTVFVKLTFALSIAHVFCNYTELSILTNINDCNHVIGSAVYGLGTRFF